MERFKAIRFQSVVTLFILAVVFFFYQNFSELRIDPNSYGYKLVELKHLSGYSHSLAFGITARGDVMGQSKGEDGLWHTVMWAPNGSIKDLGIRPEFLGDEKFKKIAQYGQPFSPKGVWIGPSLKEFGKRNYNCSDQCKMLGELSEELQLSYDDKVGILKIRGRSLSKISPISSGMAVFPNSVNSNTEVVGWGTAENGLKEHAFYWKNGKTIDLGSAAGGVSSANDINDLGQIVGETLDDSMNMRPVLWSVVGEKVRALDLSSKIENPHKVRFQGRANAINNDGQVVGLLTLETQAQPFLWTADEGMRDLNSLAIDTDPTNAAREWVLEDGRGINNCGQIIGWGRKLKSGNRYSVLLTPMMAKPGCS